MLAEYGHVMHINSQLLRWTHLDFVVFDPVARAALRLSERGLIAIGAGGLE